MNHIYTFVGLERRKQSKIGDVNIGEDGSESIGLDQLKFNY